MRTLEEFNGKYKGEPAFILGSGPSIHGQDLTPLKDKVVIAVNSGYLALPDCKFFLTDDWATASWDYFHRDLRKSKVTSALLYEKMLRDKASWFGDRYIGFRHRNGYHVTDIYQHNNPSNHILQARTSVGSAIHVAHIMGCTPVYLLGIDCCHLDGKRYFWEFDGWKKPARNDGQVQKYKKVAESDKAPQSDTDLLDILHYWEMQGQKFLEKFQVFNCSPISVLKVFPKVNLKDVL